MKTNRKRIWMTTIITSLLLAVVLVGCKKDDYVEIPGVCPVVKSTNPTNGATNVPFDQVITATFNEEMNPATITQESFTLQGGTKSGVSVAGTLTYNNTNATLSFVPSGLLTPNTTYTGTVRSTIKDLRGNALQTNYVWTFSTGVVLSPTVISTDPANLATGVFINKVVTASFSVPMDLSTINATTFTLKQGNTSVAGTVSYTGITAIFTPTGLLASNTLYTGTITTGAKNSDGTPIENNYVWTFTTGSNIGPSVISTDPTNNSTGVASDQIITATFSVPMDALTLTNSSFIVKLGLITVDGTVTYADSTASFTPSAPLQANGVYVCTITTGAKNVAGTALSDNYVWAFTTATNKAPIVISTNPVNKATGVVLNKMVVANFSELIDPLTLTTATVTLKLGPTLVAGSLIITGTSVVFLPASNLLPNSIYTATITTGVTSVAGLPLAENYVWTFTTGTVLAPTVVSTDPANKATGVLLSKLVTATFSEVMDPLSLTSSTVILKRGSTIVGGIISYVGKTVSILPNNALLPNTVYTATITSGAKNVAGIAMANDYVWTFTTLSVAAPTVILTDPLNNATGIALNKLVTATFSEIMDPLTLTAATFTLKQGTTSVPGLIAYAGKTVSLTPTAALLPNTVYTATITTGAKNVAGVAMATNYVWTFTTLVLATPTVILTDPLSNATGVVLNKLVTATFSEIMDPLTLTAATFTLKQGTTPVTGLIAYVGKTVSLTPASALLANTVYTATITTGAKNVAGVAMATNYVWSFTTLTIQAPTVLSTDPANLSTGVALNKMVAATFSDVMDPLTLTATSFTLKQGTNPVAGIISYFGKTVSLTTSAALLPNVLYTATITTAALNASGVPMASDYVWTFTTAANIAPVVMSTDPADNALNVVLNKTVTASFDVQMDPLTITTNTFTLKQGSAPVTGIVSYIGTTASFNPSADLAAGTIYTATITTGAKNLAGTSLATDHVWNFTTQAGLINPIVDLGSATIFGAFGGNAGVTNQGINTVINGAISTTAASSVVTGFHSGLTGDVYTETPLNVGLVTNGIYTAPPFPGTATSFAIATQGLLDATTAYNSTSPASMPGGMDPGAGELGGLTLAPGIYQSASGTFKISNGPLTLDAQGDPNATWIFQTAAGLTVGIAGPTGARSIILINGALPKNVFWHIGTAATINGAGGGIMVGTIIAYSGVTFSTAGNTVQTVLNGRAISLVSSVTMVNTTVNVPQ